MGLLDSFFGTDGHAGAGDMAAGRNDLGLEGDYYGDIGNLGKYDARQYQTYDPSRVNALQQEANYWGNLAKNGFTADQQNMLLGGMGNPQYQANQEMSAGRLQDQLRGIDTGGGSSNSVTAGRDANINDNAMNAYMRAKSQIGMMQMQMQQNAYANQAQAYSQMVDPYAQGAYQNLGAAAAGYGNLANSYENLGKYENEMEQANSPFSQLSGLTNEAIGLENVAKGAGGFFRKPMSTEPADPLDLNHGDKYGIGTGTDIAFGLMGLPNPVRAGYGSYYPASSDGD